MQAARREMAMRGRGNVAMRGRGTVAMRGRGTERGYNGGDLGGGI